MKTLSRRAWLIIGAITLAYVIALIADLSPYVRGPEEWRWQRWAVRALGSRVAAGGRC